MVVIALSLLAASPTIVKSLSGEKLNDSQPVFSQAYKPEYVMVVSVVAKPDDRALKLKQFLRTKGSPMANDAQALVKIADKYDLDWTFLPAIAGLESQYGKMIPAGSYNPYGWNNARTYFSDFAAASEVVAAGIRERYQPSGEVSAWNIGSRYAESKTWAVRVVRFQTEIAAF